MQDYVIQQDHNKITLSYDSSERDLYRVPFGANWLPG